MLAGYLPFDDDPANPEGDNINLLYKYIVSTPLTFPEYVTPHARDLLRRILVPNPRKRADLFEVARHSWLSEYAHIVEFITSSTTLPSDVQNASSTQEYVEAPIMTRSASVRDNAKQKSPQSGSVGGLAKATGKIDAEAEQPQRTPKDAKRRTVQVEYVAPTTQTQRGGEQYAESSSAPIAQQQRTRSSSRGPDSSRDKPLPLEPPVSRDGYVRSKPPSAHKNTPQRPTGGSRALSDDQHPVNAAARPHTGGSMSSATSMGMQNIGQYGHGQPLPPAMADTNVQGRIQQPYNPEEETIGRPSVSVPPKFARMSGFNDMGQMSRPSGESRGHKRSNTIGEIGSKLLGRNGSLFGGRSRKRSEQQQSHPSTPTEQPSAQQQQGQAGDRRRYPPVSMTNAMPTGEERASRPSIDSRTSRRSISFGMSKKRSGSVAGSQASGEKQDRRRYSFLPKNFSLKAVGLGRDEPGTPPSDYDSQPHLPLPNTRGNQRSFTAHGDMRRNSNFLDNPPDFAQGHGTANSSPVNHQRYASAQLDNRRPNAIPLHMQGGAHLNSSSNSSVDMRRPPTEPQMTNYQPAFSNSEGHDEQRVGTSRSNKGVLQKGNKRFTDAYEEESYRSHEGTSGAAKRVMDFFRRRGRARGGDDR